MTGAAIVLGAASFLSRVVGLLRDRLFAHLFGAGDTLDVYYAAFRIPDFIYNLIIVGAVSAGFIPVFAALYAKNKEESWRVTSSVLNMLAFALAIVCSGFFIFADAFVPRLVPGFSPEKIQQTILLTRILFLSPIILGVSSVVGSVLQSLRAFAIYALSPILYNIGIMIGASVFVPLFGIRGLAYGVILGACMHLAIQIPMLFSLGFRYAGVFLWRDSSVRKIALLMLPRTLGLAVSQLNLVIVTILASTLPSGSISIFNFANNIQYVPIGIIGISFAIAAFPTLASLAAAGQKIEMARQLSATVRQILFFIMPITIIALELRAQIVRVALGSGQFDWSATISTADALAFFSLSLFAQCLIPLLVRSFYALQNTWTPFAIGIVSEIVLFTASMVLKHPLGVAGLAIAFSLSMIVQLIMLWMTLRRALGSLHELPLLHMIYKTSIAAGAMAIAIQAAKSPLSHLVDMTKLWGIATQGAVAGILGLLVYGFICHFFKLEEMGHLQDTLKRRFLRLRGIPAEVTTIDGA